MPRKIAASIPLTVLGLSFTAASIPLTVLGLSFTAASIPLTVLGLSFTAASIPVTVLELSFTATCIPFLNKDAYSTAICIPLKKSGHFFHRRMRFYSCFRAYPLLQCSLHSSSIFQGFPSEPLPTEIKAINLYLRRHSFLFTSDKALLD